jgi:hypothetical protein
LYIIVKVRFDLAPVLLKGVNGQTKGATPLKKAETLVYSYSEWRKVIHRKGGEGTRAHKIGKFLKISLSFPIFPLFFPCFFIVALSTYPLLPPGYELAYSQTLYH